MTELIGFFSWNCTQCEFFNFSSNLLLKKSYFSVKLLHHSLLYFLRESIYLIIFYLLSSFWQFLREIVYYGSPFFLGSLSKIVNSTLTYNLVTSNSLTMQLRLSVATFKTIRTYCKIIAISFQFHGKIAVIRLQFLTSDGVSYARAQYNNKHKHWFDGKLVKNHWIRPWR